MKQLALPISETLQGVCAVAYDKNDDEYDVCYTWEAAQTIAREGYRIVAVSNDGFMSKEKIQSLCDYELEIALDCFGKEYQK